MSGTDWLLVATVFVLFVGSAVLALSETAFTKVSRIRALALAEEGNRSASRLVKMLEDPARTLNSVLLILLVFQFTAATLVGVLLEQLGAVAVLVGTVLEVTLFFVVAEVAPKTYAVQHPERAALRVTPLLWFLTHFAPLRVLSAGLIGVANVVLPGKGLKQGPYVTEEEIRTMADVAADEDAIAREERKLIHSIFEFGDTVVREVMLPRPDIVAVEVDDTIEAAIEVAIDGGFSRLPACEGGTDNIRRARIPQGPRPAGTRAATSTTPCAKRSGRLYSCPSRSESRSCYARCVLRSSTWPS